MANDMKPRPKPKPFLPRQVCFGEKGGNPIPKTHVRLLAQPM